MSENIAMSMVDRYLEEVRRHLPEDLADDIVAELRTHILDKAEDMGGLTPENVQVIIQRLGPPRKLAERYVVGRGKKVLRFELGIPEDLYPAFLALVAFLSIAMMVSVIADVIESITSNSEFSAGAFALDIIGALISIAFMVLFMYLVFSFIGSNPDLRESVRRAIDSAFKSLGFAEKKKRGKKRLRISRKVLPWFQLTNAIFLMILAYLIYYYLSMPPFNWLMQLLVYTLVIYFGTESLLSYIHFFYMELKGEKSYTLEFLSSLAQLVFLPWLFLANLFPEKIQILNLRDIENYEGIDEFLRNTQPIYVPPEHLIAVKIVLMMFLIAVVVDIIIIVLKYVRTAPHNGEPDNKNSTLSNREIPHERGAYSS